jgi:putative membrane protein
VKRLLGELLFIAGCAAIVWFAIHGGVQPVFAAMARVGLGGLLLLCLAHIPTIGVLGLSWWLLAGRPAGSRPEIFAWGRSVRDAAGDLLPFSPVGGYVLGARAITLTGVTAFGAAVSSLLDIALEQLAKTPYSLMSLWLIRRAAPDSTIATAGLLVMAATFGACLLAIWRWDWLRRKLLAAAERIGRLARRSDAAGERSSEAVLAQLLARRSRMALCFLLQLTGWILGAAETWLCLHLLGTSVDFSEALAVDGGYATIRTAAFAVPAAVGVQEGSYIALLGIFGVDPSTALAFSLLKRARDVMIGGPALLFWQLLERLRPAVAC